MCVTPYTNNLPRRSSSNFPESITQGGTNHAASRRAGRSSVGRETSRTVPPRAKSRTGERMWQGCFHKRVTPGEDQSNQSFMELRPIIVKDQPASPGYTEKEQKHTNADTHTHTHVICYISMSIAHQHFTLVTCPAPCPITTSGTAGAVDMHPVAGTTRPKGFAVAPPQPGSMHSAPGRRGGRAQTRKRELMTIATHTLTLLGPTRSAQVTPKRGEQPS